MRKFPAERIRNHFEQLSSSAYMISEMCVIGVAIVHHHYNSNHYRLSDKFQLIEIGRGALKSGYNLVASIFRLTDLYMSRLSI